MEKRLISENFTCEELGRELINDFKSMKCDELEAFAILNWKKLDEEILESDKITQVSDAISKFSFKESKFKVKNLQEILTKYIFEYTYLRIYFTCNSDGTNLNLVFKFSENDVYQSDFSKEADTEVYELQNEKLVLVATVADFDRVKQGITLFEEYFKKFDPSSFTKYVTFHMEKIKRNFRRFKDDCVIWVGAREPYKRVILRLNLILDIDRGCVRHPAHTNSVNRQYFNMGHLYP